MHHIAIMKKSWNLIPKILSGEKTIESRWYKNKSAPWDKIKIGDIIYFKNSGEKIIAKAEVSKIIQFENLDKSKIKEIIEKYGQAICLQDTNYQEWADTKKYCILIFLKNPQKIDKPFLINKTGFGIGSAWLCVENINKLSC